MATSSGSDERVRVSGEEENYVGKRERFEAEIREVFSIFDWKKIAQGALLHIHTLSYFHHRNIQHDENSRMHDFFWTEKKTF